MILPLLQLGGEENYQRYEATFNRWYFPSVTDVLGNQVVFDKKRCWHVCYKRDDEGYSAGRPYRRNVWSQERAERIGWIGAALSDPTTDVRPNKVSRENRLSYLLVVTPERKEEQDYYLVIVEKAEPGIVDFITAYPITHKQWNDAKREGPSLNPKPKKKPEGQMPPPVSED